MDEQTMQTRGWSVSDTGVIRDANQDATLVEPGRGVFAVADGLGGKEGGGEASAAAIRGIREHLDELEDLLADGDPANDRKQRARIVDFLIGRLYQVNRELYAAADGDMGTTCDVLVLSEGVGFVAHVGDSRVYLMRGNRIHQLTDDHTFAEKIRREQRRMGRASEFEVGERYEHVLTRSLGGRPEVDVDTLFIDVQPGDRFLLCTDGLSDVLDDEEVLLANETQDPQELAQHLVEAALEAETTDNVSVVVASVPETTSTSFERNRPVDTLRKISFLEQIDLFQDLDAQELLRILRVVYKEVYQKGDRIIERGNRSNRMYMILEGEVALKVEGHEVGRLSPGEHFGEMALFSDQPRSADAVALEEVILLAVPSDQFEQLVEVEDVELGNKLLHNLLNRAAARIRETTVSLLEAREGESGKAAALGRADTLEIDSDLLDVEPEEIAGNDSE